MKSIIHAPQHSASCRFLLAFCDNVCQSLRIIALVGEPLSSAWHFIGCTRRLPATPFH
jgi:hypothetical protein